EEEATPWTRRWGIWALGLWTSWLIHQRLRDVTSGFMALSPGLVRYLAGSFPAEVADANVLVRVQRSGFRIAEVPVSMAPRTGGQGMHGGWRSGVHGARVLALATWEANRNLG
ncbi:MAG: hypothetical protein QGG40_21730, partial [Myxococcota bacterium]|nr:hypothetical protein [Myxococcota bacterium]